MNIDTDAVLLATKHIIQEIKKGTYYKSYRHLDEIDIAALIRVITTDNPLSQEDLCYHFRRNGFGNTVIIGYMLNKFCRGTTRDFLWYRDELGRFHPANSYRRGQGKLGRSNPAIGVWHD